MSQRGSFVTEFIYCKACFQAAKTVLLSRDKWMCSVAIPHWNQDAEGHELPIIAGKIGSEWSEAGDMDHEIGPRLAKVICHTIRIAILEEVGLNADQSARTIVVTPETTG